MKPIEPKKIANELKDPNTITHTRSINISDGAWRAIRDYAADNECSVSAAVRSLIRIGLRSVNK